MGRSTTRRWRALRAPPIPRQVSSSTSWLNSCWQASTCAGSQRRGVGFAGADAYGVVDVVDEDFAVADLAGFGGGRNGIDDLVGLFARNSDFDLDLRQEVHGVLSAAIDFSVALLTPVSLDLGDGQPVHPCRSQSVADLVELERLDDGHDDFHGFDPRLGPSLRVQVVGNPRCAWTRGSRGFARQSYCRESSGVPVRCVSRKCVETKGVCRLREEVLRPFVKRRTNTAQGCTIFNQGTRGLGCSCARRARGAQGYAHGRLGGTSGVEFETAVNIFSAEVV